MNWKGVLPARTVTGLGAKLLRLALGLAFTVLLAVVAYRLAGPSPDAAGVDSTSSRHDVQAEPAQEVPNRSSDLPSSVPSSTPPSPGAASGIAPTANAAAPGPPSGGKTSTATSEAALPGLPLPSPKPKHDDHYWIQQAVVRAAAIQKYEEFLNRIGQRRRR